MALSPELPEPIHWWQRGGSRFSTLTANEVSSDRDNDGLRGMQCAPLPRSSVTRQTRPSTPKPASMAKPPKSTKYKSSSTAAQKAFSAVGTKHALKEARTESSQRLRLAWDDIFDRYTRNEHLATGRDDIYDFETGQVVHDGGFLDDTIELLSTVDGERPIFAANAEIPIGHFGLPGALGQDDRLDGSSEEEDDAQASHSDAEATQRQEPEAALDLDSSEDELGVWLGGHVQPVSATFKRAQREKHDLSEDLRHFMSINDRSSQMLQLQAFDSHSARSDSPVSVSRAKEESVKPSIRGIALLKAGTPNRLSSPASVPYTWPKLGYFKPSTHSSPMPCVSPSRSNSVMSIDKSVSSFSLASSKPSSRTSTLHRGAGFGISAKVKLDGGNAILTQAYSNDADSSDDDFGITQSTSHRRPISGRAYSTAAKSERASSTSVDVGALDSPSVRAASTTPRQAVIPSSPQSSSRSKRRQPVIEVIVRSRSLPMLPYKNPWDGSDREASALTFSRLNAAHSPTAPKHAPRRPSPLKQPSISRHDLSPSVLCSSISSPAQQKHLLSSRFSPDMDETDVFRVASVKPNLVPHLQPTLSHLDPSRSFEIFGRSKSQKPDFGGAQRPSQHGVFFSAAGLPTPPPSSASSTSKSMSPERAAGRQSIIPMSLSNILSASVGQTVTMIHNPAKRKRDEGSPKKESPKYIVINSDDDSTDDELLLETPNRNRRMTSVSLPFSLSSPAKSAPSLSTCPGSPAQHPERLRCSSLIRCRSRSTSASPSKLRGRDSPAVWPSPARSRNMAPIIEADGEESDDPLGI